MLYQLPGQQHLKVGNLVNIGPGGHRFGIVQSVIKENYQMSDKCVVSGTGRFNSQPVHLFLIRGCANQENRPVAGYAWAFT